MSGGIEHSALEFLRTQGNPFEDLVRPQRPNDRFERSISWPHPVV